MDEFSNPFRPGAGTAPPALIGRDVQIQQVQTAARRAMSGTPGKSVMPIGLRGVGKTVLLNKFVEVAEAVGMESVFIEAPENDDFKTLLAVKARKLLLGLESGSASRALNKALSVLKSFTYTLADGSALSLNIDHIPGTADSGILSEDLTDLFEAIGDAAVERGTGVVFAIDEVQYLNEDELSAVITAVHRTVQRNLPILLVGAGLPQLPGLAGDAKSYAERLFDFPTIGSLEPAEAELVLTDPAERQQVSFEPEALAIIVEKTHGYPYFLQEWGYHVWNVAGHNPISRADVEAADTLVWQQLDANFFRVRADRLTDAEKRYLSAMAELGAGPHRSGDIAEKLGVRVESVGPRRGTLIRKGMIYSPSHGDTAFTVPLFDEFLRRTQPWSDDINR